MPTFTIEPSSINLDDLHRYNNRVALFAVEHAVAAYLDEASLQAAAKSIGYTGARLIDIDSAQVAIIYSPGITIIAPRGSSELTDWRDDFGSVFLSSWDAVLPRNYTYKWDGQLKSGHPRIGWGFKRQAKLITYEILQHITTFHRPGSLLIIACHSLGAAIGPLTAAYLAKHNVYADLVSCFSSPRIGNEAWSAWYRDTLSRRIPTWNCANTRQSELDMVVDLPPRWMGFRHLAGKVILVGNDTTLHGERAWRKYLELYKQPWWRIGTRAARQVQAHLGQLWLDTLRARVTNIEGVST